MVANGEKVAKKDSCMTRLAKFCADEDENVKFCFV